MPGCKAQFEIDMEREEEELRRLRLNPVFKDGGRYLRPYFRSFRFAHGASPRFPVSCTP